MEPRIIPYEKSDSPVAESGRPVKVSSQAAVAFYADQARHVELARPHDLLLAQVPGEQIPHRLALVVNALGHRRPARDLVGLARLARTLADAHVHYARAPLGAGVAAVGHSADPHHVAAL